eukprot:12690742-Alexandrium_andersonii.AAC.1
MLRWRPRIPCSELPDYRLGRTFLEAEWSSGFTGANVATRGHCEDVGGDFLPVLRPKARGMPRGPLRAAAS